MNSTFWFSLDHQDLDAGMKMNGFAIKPSSFTLKVSNEILMKDFKPVVMEKSNFEYPGFSKLMALLRIFQTIGVLKQESK